jgi:hypothetical protein
MRSKSHTVFRIHLVHGSCLAASLAAVVATGFHFSGLTLFGLVAAGASVRGWVRALRMGEERETAKLRVSQALLAKGDMAGAQRLATDLSASATVLRVRNAALTTVAWAALGEGHLDRAKEALDHIQPQHHIDLHCFAAVEDALGKSRIAIQALELDTNLSCSGSQLLVDLYAREGNFERAVGAAITHRHALGVENCRLVVEAAFGAWALKPAASLAAVLFMETGATPDAAALIRSLAHQHEFVDVFRTVDNIIAHFDELGRRAQARSLLASLRLDRSLPSGVCRELDRKLRSLELEGQRPVSVA